MNTRQLPQPLPRERKGCFHDFATLYFAAPIAGEPAETWEGCIECGMALVPAAAVIELERLLDGKFHQFENEGRRNHG